MKKHSEVMNHFFEDSEHQKVQEKIDALGLQQRQEAIKSQSIDIKLNALDEAVKTKTESNFEKRFEAYKTAVLEAEKSIIDSTKGVVEDVTENAVNQASDAVKNSVFSGINTWFKTLIAGAGLGSVWVWISNNINPGKEIASWFEGTWLGGLLGITPKTETKPEETEGANDTSSEIVDPPKNDTQTPTSPKESNETIEIDTPDSHYLYGAKFIVALTADSSAPVNEDSKSTYKGLENMSYNQVRSLSSQNIPEGFYQDDSQKEKRKDVYAHTINALKSDASKDLLRISLKKDFLPRIIKPRDTWNEDLFPYFGDSEKDSKQYLTEILDGKVSWEDLSFKQISILYFHSLSTLKIPAIDGMKDLWGDIQKLLVWDDSDLSESINSAKNSIPKELLHWFSKLGTSILTDSSLNLDANTVDTIFSDIPAEKKDESREVFDDIMLFQKHVLSNEFITNPKLGLSPEQQKLYKDHISLGHIISMYTLMGGNPELKMIPTLSLPPMIYLVGKILERGNSAHAYQAKLYLWNYTKNVLFWNQKWLSDDEYKIMEIYGEKTLDLIFLSHLRSIQWALWLSESGTWLSTWELAAWIGWTWVLSRIIWNISLKKGIKKWNFSLFWATLKKFWNIWIITGLVLWGTHWYTKLSTGQAWKDLSSAQESWDLSKIIQTLKKQRDSIKDINIGGIEAKVYAYPGDAPLYIINGKVHALKVWELNLNEIINEIKNKENTTPNIKDTQRIWDNFVSSIFPSTEITNGIDYSKQRHDGEKVILGNEEASLTLSFEEIIQKISSVQKTIVWQDAIRSWTDGEHYLPILWNAGEKWFVISKVPWDTNKILFAAEIWSVEDLFGTQES